MTGPSHLAAGEPNQDAWAKARVQEAGIVVVSDGLGSRPHSAEGAKAACAAAIQAVKLSWASREAPLDVVVALIHVLWKLRVSPLPPSECACTCLLAAMRPDGSGLAAQLGDGVVLLREGTVVEQLSSTSRSFSNVTDALGVTKTIGKWNTRMLSPGRRTIVLCTDGVADDILPERYPEFVDWLGADIAPLEPRARWQTLAKELRGWPTPGHLDDKTLAVLSNEEAAK